MTILGIETSCDETALALVRGGRLVDEKLATQEAVHAVFGGVVPEVASREHLRIIHYLYEQLMRENGLNAHDLKGVAVARGPGLLGSLLVGMAFAKGIAYASGTKIIGVNHLHAHLLAAGLHSRIAFPSLGLLVSGGHTHIYLIKDVDDFVLLGRTLDDAAGEAFDKVAKLLNLPYPGGKYIDLLSQQGVPDKRLFPRPFIDNQNLDFSFSGIKTAVGVYLQKNSHLILPSMPLEKANDLSFLPDSYKHRQELCDTLASYTYSITESLRIKLERALMTCRETGQDIRSIVVAGGVAANSTIRSTLKSLANDADLEFILPDFHLCTDNAQMIAYAGELLIEKGFFHDMSLEAIPRGKPIPEDWKRH